MKLLIVEDEKKTAQYLKKGLTENGFTVDLAEDGEEGLHLALHAEYDLLILDVMLPKRDGLSILSEVRRSGKQTLALLLSARDAVPDRVKGLDEGADAYLVKPFAFSELLALVRSLLRQGPQSSARHHPRGRFGNRPLSSQSAPKQTKFRSDTQGIFFACTLGQESGEIISRTIMSEEVWGLSFDSDTNVVDVHIRRLRAKVDDPFEKKLIQTVRGMGYVLRAENQ